MATRTRAPRKPAKPAQEAYTVHTQPWSEDYASCEETFERLYRLGAAFDTETTGLDSSATIFDIALVEISSGKQLFHSFVKPLSKFHPDLTSPMGKFRINPRDYDSAPSWNAVEPQFRAALGDRGLVCWAAHIPHEMVYDRRLIDQTRQAAGFPPLDPGDLGVFNVKPLHYQLRKPLYQQLRAIKGEGGLSRALRLEGLEFTGQEHTALVDAIGVADLVRAVVKHAGARMVAELPDPVAELERLRSLPPSAPTAYPVPPPSTELLPGMRVQMLNHVTWRYGTFGTLLRKESNGLWNIIFDEDNEVLTFTHEDFKLTEAT